MGWGLEVEQHTREIWSDRMQDRDTRLFVLKTEEKDLSTRTWEGSRV